jgi:hypothetical protein
LTFAVSLIPVPHPGTLRSSVVVAFPIVSIPTLATAVESTPLVVVVVTSRLVLPFFHSAVPIVSGALIAFPPVDRSPLVKRKWDVIYPNIPTSAEFD